MSTRRLAAIMFADIVGYTAMMQRNEKEGLAKVHHFSQVVEEQVAAHQGEVLQFQGDGCLCIFQSAVQAMHAAKTIQQQLQETPEVPLRIGIHIGDIVMKEGNIYGDGVNLASRVESMGVPGSVLVTERVIHDVKSHPEFEMASLGKFQFKNVQKPMEVFALANEGFSIPRRNEIKGKFADSHRKTMMTRLRYYALGLLIAGTFGYLGWALSQNPPGQTSNTEGQVIAVLPFDDMSPKADQQYFCEGVAEEILNALAKLKGLQVRGRASSFSLKSRDLTIKEMGEALGTTILLDGSIRKKDGTLRIKVELIDVDKETPIWSQQYDRESEDIFAVQEDIARQVIDKLQITLLPGERETLLAAQTKNPLAHEWYLKGVHASLEGARKYRESVSYFSRAISLDSAYYQAMIELSDAYKHLIIYGREYHQLDSSLYWAHKAIELNPNLPEAYHKLALWEILYFQDWEKANQYYQEAINRGLPALSQIRVHLSILEGNYARALAEAKAIVENDPFSLMEKVNLSRTALWAGAYQEQLTIAGDILTQHPGQASTLRHKGEALLALNKPDEALLIFEDLVKLDGYGAYGYVICLQRLLKEKEAKEVFQHYREKTHFTEQAYCFIEFGQQDSAIYQLSRAIAERDIAVSLALRNNAFLKPLYDDPRYQALIRRLNYPKKGSF